MIIVSQLAKALYIKQNLALGWESPMINARKDYDSNSTYLYKDDFFQLKLT